MAYIPQPLMTASGSITTQNLVPLGTATAGSAVEITLNGTALLEAQVTGTYTGALSVQVTVDGAIWVTMTGTAYPIFNAGAGSQISTIASATPGVYQIPVAGATKARITALATVTGAAVITLRSVINTNLISVMGNLNSIATVSTLTGTNSLTPGTAAANLGKAEDAVHASGDTGIYALSVRADSPTAQSSATGDYASFLTDADGRLWVNNQLANIRDSAHTHYRNTALANTGVSVKASAGNLYAFNFINPDAVNAVFVKFYNSATAPTAGVGTPFKVIMVPAGASVTNLGNVLMSPDDSAYAYFSTGIAVIVTRGLADNDTTAPTAIYAEIVYK